MVNANLAVANMVGGELSPTMAGRTDLPVFKRGVARAQNFIVLPQGPAMYRMGTRLVHRTRLNKLAWFIPFQFNDQQSYLVEGSDQKFRFYKDNSIIVEAAKNISGITNATQASIHSPGHGYSDGREIFLNDIIGMTGLNGRAVFTSDTTMDDYKIKDVDGNYINTTASGTYVSGGTSKAIYESTTPYLEADVKYLQYAQNADTMYLVNQNYEPRKLTRSGHANWSLATFTRDNDPFTSNTKWPRAVSFTDDGCLAYGGTKDNPETFWKSRQPGSGGVRYDDFNTGTDDDYSVRFTLAPVRGKVDAIRWITNTDKFLVMGTYSTVRRVYGATQEDPITPTSITAKSASTYGCALTLPVSNGINTFYIQRGGQLLRSFEYDFQSDGYVTTDRNIVADHITAPGLEMLSNQQSKPEILWALRTDGVLLGLTYKDKEDISGWHRHYVGGQHVDANGVLRPWGKVISIAPMPRESSLEQLWMIVERFVDGKTIRTVEYMADEPVYPVPDDFFTGKENKEEDLARYRDAVFEIQKGAVHLDMALTYDGSQYGTNASAALTIAATTGDSVSVVASAPVFTAGMVGREIWKPYDVSGTGGGRAEIIAYTDSTHVTVKIKSGFNSTAIMPAGKWYLTAETLTGLEFFEGATVSVITDGGPHNEVEVVNGSLTLDYPASVAHVGFGYIGMLKTLNLDVGGVTGSAQTKPRNIVETHIRFLNSVGAQFGTDLYRLEPLTFTSTSDITGRPTPLYSGTKPQYYEDATERDKAMYVVQDKPLPCTVLVVDIFTETTDE